MKLVLRDPTCFLFTITFLVASSMSGCKSKSPEPTSTAQNTGQSVALQPSPQSSVDDLVAPIALYPDQLLAQVLAVSVTPQEVLDLGNWLLQNQNLQGDAMTTAARTAGFSPSAQYLALFPQVVDNMCQQLDWTRQLGEAFKADQKSVMDAVQRKRTQAQQMRNLTSSPQMTVNNKTAENGQPYVEIQSADPKVVYVPQYNPVTIYNSPAPSTPAQSTSATTTSESSGVSGGEAAAIGLLSFGVGMALGAAINNDDYYPYPSWGHHSVYVARGPYYPAAYRPPAYAGYRPAYGYSPPSNYRWNQYNRNANVTVNNNYYNRFNSGSVNRGSTRQAYANPNRTPVQNQPNWKGQSSYQGARATSTRGRQPGSSVATGESNANRTGLNKQKTDNTFAGGELRGSGARVSTQGENRAADRTADNGRTIDRDRSSAASALPQSDQSGFNHDGDRGYGTRGSAERSFDPGTTSGASRTQGAAAGSGAFGGGSGRQERIASDRGRSSTNGRRRR